MWLYGYIGMISPHHGMEPWQEQHPKACLQLSSCYDHRCFRVCTYVCRKAYELYFLYRNLISVFKMPKKNELKRIYIYMFVCKLRECLLEERKEWTTHQHCVEAICWMLKSLCENVKCWRNLQSAPHLPSSFREGCFSKLYTLCWNARVMWFVNFVSMSEKR